MLFCSLSFDDAHFELSCLSLFKCAAYKSYARSTYFHRPGF